MISNRAHQAVLKAQRQVEMLTPLVADCDTACRVGLARSMSCAGAAKRCAGTSPHLKLGLLDKRLAHAGRRMRADSTHTSSVQEARRDQQRHLLDELKQAINENGGDRLERLGAEITDEGGDAGRAPASRRGATAS